MTDEETIQKLLDLRLTTMAQAFRDLHGPSRQSKPTIFHRRRSDHGRSRVDRPRQPPTRAPAPHAARLTIREISRERVVRTAAWSRQIGDARPRDVPDGSGRSTT